MISIENDIMPRVNRELPELECVRLRFSPAQCSLWQSKLGGIPYYPKDMEYPTGSGSCEGETLRFLCQLNFAELPHIDGFPDKGILQFFISGDLDMALPDTDTTEGGYKVVYHRDINEDASLLYSEDDIPEADVDDDMFPIHDEYRITGRSAKSLPMMDDHRFDGIVLDMFEQQTGIRTSSCLDLISREYNAQVKKVFGSEEAFDRLWEINRSDEPDSPSLIGGYPRFDQSDPRVHGFEDHTVMLLQLGSVYDDDVSIEWGDGGTAHFFITPKALKELDFSEAFFYWDCG